MIDRWKNLVINLVLVIVLALALCGCITIETPTSSGEPSDGSPPQAEDKAEKHLSFQITEPDGQTDYLYTFPIYLEKGDRLHLYWSATDPIIVGYVIPSGAYFGSHSGSEYWLRPELDIGVDVTDGYINIRVGQTHEAGVEHKGDESYIVVPAGVYEPGYYQFRFLSDYMPFRDEITGITYDYTSVEVRYRID